MTSMQTVRQLSTCMAVFGGPMGEDPRYDDGDCLSATSTSSPTVRPDALLRVGGCAASHSAASSSLYNSTWHASIENSKIARRFTRPVLRKEITNPSFAQKQKVRTQPFELSPPNLPTHKNPDSDSPTNNPCHAQPTPPNPCVYPPGQPEGRRIP